MAKGVKAKRPKKPEAAPGPSELCMRLYGPGMSVLHRAGLGGLACSLRALEQARAAGALLEEDWPGGQWADEPPWDVTANSITLRFGRPEGAREYLRRLFRFSFGLKDGLIWLPGQYGDMTPSLTVRAEIQVGLTLTFLQHGKTRRLDAAVAHQIDPTGDGDFLTIEYRPCTWYKHQDGWEAFTDEAAGTWKSGPAEVIGPLSPGAVVRHVAYTADTRIEEQADRVLCLYFALVGCLALAVNRGVGVLLAPDVEDVRAFARERPLMTPASPVECRITSAGDAALQAQVRLRGRGLLDHNELPACYSARFQPTPWASQQKSRVETLLVERQLVARHQPERETQDERSLHQFETALALLKPRVRPFGTSGEQFFWTDSVVRPLIADNLARRRPWYEGFATLMTKIDPATKKPVRDRLRYETGGLSEMSNDPTMLDGPEGVLVCAVHDAIRFNLSRIRRDTDGDKPLSQATLNRWDRFRERLRLALVGAKTADQCRAALCTLFGKAGHVEPLQHGWRALMPMLLNHWQLARDLALLAMASYSRQEVEATEPSPSEAPQ